MLLRQGSYTGTGIARSITNVGINPDWVLIIRIDANQDPIYRITGHAANKCRSFGGSGSAVLISDGILAFANDLFTLGTGDSGNKSGASFVWFALQLESADSSIVSYVGDGNDNRSLTGAGFQPDMLWHAERATNGIRTPWRTADMVGDLSIQNLGIASNWLIADMLQLIESDGFEVGLTSVNLAGKNYDVLCLKNASNFKVLKYVGDGITDRIITGVGFRPNLVMVKSGLISPSPTEGVMKLVGHAAALSSKLRLTGEVANMLIGFEADGFKLGVGSGSGELINENGQDYYAFCMDALDVEGGSALSLPVIIS